MGPQTHEIVDLRNRLLSRNRRATTQSYINHSLTQPKPSPPSSSIFPEYRLLWTAVRQPEILSLNSFYQGRDLFSSLFNLRLAKQLWQPHSSDQESHVKTLLYPRLTEMNKQPLLLQKLPECNAGSWEHPFFTSHSPAKDSLVEKKTKSNTPLFSETQRFQCAHPQWGQSKLVWIQDWCWTHTMSR